LKYDLNSIDSYVHLTNYSVQKYCPEFAKYEIGNEVPFEDFQSYLDEKYKDKNIKIKEKLWPQFLEIIQVSTRSV